MFNTLSYIGKKLNDADITWGVGASILLNRFGLIDKPNDIDIFVSINDIEKTDEILKSIGEKKKWEKTTTYSTKYLYEYVINKVDVDVMAGFVVNHNNGAFRYIFDKSSISEYKVINEVKIPFTSLEDWYVIYQLIPNRKAKVEMIEKYIVSNGIKKSILLERALQGCLPIDVRRKVEDILNQYKN